MRNVVARPTERRGVRYSYCSYCDYLKSLLKVGRMANLKR